MQMRIEARVARISENSNEQKEFENFIAERIQGMMRCSAIFMPMSNTPPSYLKSIYDEDELLEAISLAHKSKEAFVDMLDNAINNLTKAAGG